MKRFYYRAFREAKEHEGIIRADSIDSAKEKLIQKGYEEVTLDILSSPDADLDCSPDETIS
jgi:hypothetical protein